MERHYFFSTRMPFAAQHYQFMLTVHVCSPATDGDGKSSKVNACCDVSVLTNTSATFQLHFANIRPLGKLPWATPTFFV